MKRKHKLWNSVIDPWREAPVRTGPEGEARFMEALEDGLGGEEALQLLMERLMEENSYRPLSTFQFLYYLNEWSDEDFTQLFCALQETSHLPVTHLTLSKRSSGTKDN